MEIYVVEHASGRDIYRSYEGQPEAAVRALIEASGNSFELISKDAYDSGLAALPPRP